MLRKMWMLGMLSAVFVSPLQSVSAISLSEAIDAALKHEDQMQISQLRLVQQDAVVQQAQRRYGLDVNLVGQIGREKVVAHHGTIFPSEGYKSIRSAELQADYPLYTWGRKQLEIQSAKLRSSAQVQALSGQRARTILTTVQVYTDVLKQYALSQLQLSTLENLRRSVYEADKKFSAGVITRADLAQVKAQYAQGQADSVLARSNLDISQTEFYKITGVDISQMDDSVAVPNYSPNLSESLEMIERHPSLQQAKLELDAASSQYDLVKAQLKPMLSLTSRIGTQHELHSINSESENYMMGVQLKIPLFDHGRNAADRKKASADRMLAAQQVEVVRHDLEAETKTVYSQLGAVRENKKAIDEAIESAEIALHFITRELEVGTKTSYDFLMAEQKVLELHTQKIVNQQDEVILVYRLLDLTGQL
ncbi:TolC family protein [Acinetobacter sp.]|uniref:TolC family protein n=1 Tax=Acinetobacter sp. TaxID=472 RepID=UPI0035AD796D